MKISIFFCRLRAVAVVCLVTVLFWSGSSYAGSSVKIVSFNIANFGKSKIDTRLDTMAGWLASADLIVIQEVVAGPYGARAVAALAASLQRTGSDWDYAVSDPTNGPGTERYAFIWKKHRLLPVGKPRLIHEADEDLDREPYAATFKTPQGKTFTVLNFHAVPQSKEPEREVFLLSPLHKLFPGDHLIICGDFNLKHSSEAFLPLYSLGFAPALLNTRTTVKMKRDAAGLHLANAFDNFYFEKDEFDMAWPGVIDFAASFTDLKFARRFSDHLPIVADFSVK